MYFSGSVDNECGWFTDNPDSSDYGSLAIGCYGRIYYYNQYDSDESIRFGDELAFTPVILDDTSISSFVIKSIYAYNYPDYTVIYACGNDYSAGYSKVIHISNKTGSWVYSVIMQSETV